ncbi:MAG: ribonuclease III domain-containing protein [Anaerovoracaceae bacterium]
MKNIKNIKTTALAYMGDSVYEVYVRKHVMETGVVDANRLHKMGVEYVKADAQAYAIKKLFEELSEEEKALVKRSRNHKTGTKAKNANIITYKWATAFESLIGFLYLSDNIERLEEIVYKTMEVIDEQGR